MHICFSFLHHCVSACDRQGLACFQMSWDTGRRIFLLPFSTDYLYNWHLDRDWGWTQIQKPWVFFSKPPPAHFSFHKCFILEQMIWSKKNYCHSNATNSYCGLMVSICTYSFDMWTGTKKNIVTKTSNSILSKPTTTVRFKNTSFPETNYVLGSLVSMFSLWVCWWCIMALFQCFENQRKPFLVLKQI